MVLRKDELEVQLKDEHQLIKDGVLKDDSPLDLSPEFTKLCNACRRGDLKHVQEAITAGSNINARDEYDYTPLILASLCGHYEVVELLLESGALCERDTFQGERCLYNALTDRIRNLLLKYDYSKSTDPLQPLASHITSLLTKRTPKTSDITLTSGLEEFHLHKFILSARSPYFYKKFAAAPETVHWKLAHSVPAESFWVAIRYLYLGEVPIDLGMGPKSVASEEEIIRGIDKVSKHLEIERLWEGILAGNDRRIARQRHQDEVSLGRDQLEQWFKANVLAHEITIDSSRANDVKWTRNNSIFADVILRADTPSEAPSAQNPSPQMDGIPIGPSPSAPAPPPRSSLLIPCHRAMLIRSEYFSTMFSSSFLEAQETPYLQIVSVDVSPAVLQVILTFLYTEKVDFPLELAIDVLFAADMLFIEKLKTKAAILISSLGMGSSSALVDRTHAQDHGGVDDKAELINIYDVIRAAWMTRVQRLEEFAARYLAYRLEEYVDDEEFEELILESAARVENRQETDTIELLDDIRYYLSDRFRLCFEDTHFEYLEEEEANPISHQDAIDAVNGEKRAAGENEQNGEETTSAQEQEAGIQAIRAGEIRTLDGDIAGDEFASDAINYQVLLGKIDALLERLKLDA